VPAQPEQGPSIFPVAIGWFEKAQTVGVGGSGFSSCSFMVSAMVARSRTGAGAGEEGSGLPAPADSAHAPGGKQRPWGTSEERQIP